MTERRWTLLLLEDRGGLVRQVTLSKGKVRALFAGFGALAVLLFLAITYTLLQGVDHARAALLARKNAILSQELNQFRERLRGLEAVLSELGEKDSRIRLLAGLDTTPPEVRLAGVGGPGLPSLDNHPLWPLDAEVGKTAFAVDYDLRTLERRARLLQESFAEASDSLEAQHDLLSSTPSILPTAGVLTSRFSSARLHPIHHLALPHQGIDISAPHGTPILAAAKGTVVFAGWRPGLGYTVEIDHGYGYLTRYGHASRLLVRWGDRVSRGQPIALVGSTGISTSPHLHYEVHVGGRAVNPLNYILGNVLP